MKVHILENVEFEGRNFEKGTNVLMVLDEAKRLIETGKATPENTNRSVGLDSSNVDAPVKRGKK